MKKISYFINKYRRPTIFSDTVNPSFLKRGQEIKTAWYFQIKKNLNWFSIEILNEKSLLGESSEKDSDIIKEFLLSYDPYDIMFHRQTKYLMSSNMIPTFFCAPINHSDMTARQNIISAWFFKFNDNPSDPYWFDVDVWGESSSLDLKSSHEDANLIKNFFIN